MNETNAGIADYILIGNCRSAALVSKYGSIDWCCIPEFHSPAIFAALLDNRMGGFFVIQPVKHFRSSQQYVHHTNVAELLFENEEGSVKLTDCFVAMEENQKQAELFPDHEILRVAECLSGEVTLRCEYQPRAYYGRDALKLTGYGRLGVHFTYRENVCVFQATTEEIILNDSRDRVYGEFCLKEGERAIFSFSCSSQHPAIIPEIGATAAKRLENTISYWQQWAGRCRYQGIFCDRVVRSALTLKLLAHAPSGAIVAAPTTSLPEAVGGIRNWDYRFCWLRDASFTARALIKLGYYDEAHAYMSWILHATRLTRPKLQVVYSVFGNSRLKESTCNWLKGYKNSRPVRIGNDAHNQYQLDVYGEVLDAVYTYSRIIDEFDSSTRRFLVGLGKTICRLWPEPDDGIWEIRSAARHHTHSKVMAWVGLDRLIKLCNKYGWKNAPLQQFMETKQSIQQSVEDAGFNKELNSYVKDFHTNHVDAALLTFSLVGYCDAEMERMAGTLREIKKQLSDNGFIYRYLNNDGLPGGEGAFIVANFWLIEALAKSGKTDEAIDLFNRIMEAAPPHGLLAEEIDPASGEWLGNYPQGFSHIGLINAALTINEQLSVKKERS